jgi:hypothetical protein
MIEKTNRKGGRKKKQETQETQINQQERTTIEQTNETKDDENKQGIELPDTYKDTADKEQKDTAVHSSFLDSLAKRIMNKLLTLYGNSIEGETCKKIIEIAKTYAKTGNTQMQDTIDRINIFELYDSIIKILKQGYYTSPLDETYNDILIKAIIDKYKL